MARAEPVRGLFAKADPIVKALVELSWWMISSLLGE
jgi:hypothetical protein